MRFALALEYFNVRQCQDFDGAEKFLVHPFLSHCRRDPLVGFRPRYRGPGDRRRRRGGAVPSRRRIAKAGAGPTLPPLEDIRMGMDGASSRWSRRHRGGCDHPLRKEFEP